MPRKKRNPSKGRSIVLRAEPDAVVLPPSVVVPGFSASTEPHGASSMEAEERRTQLSFSLKLPGLRVMLDTARFFRRGKARRPK